MLAAALVLLALLAVPAPLLPPHALAEAVQSVLGASWKAAYLVAALGLQSVFYGSLGVLATFSLRRAQARRERVLQVALMPWAVVGVAVLVRSLKAGHLPAWTNAIVPIIACVVGVGLGLGLRYRSGKATLGVAVVVVGVTLWAWRADPPSALRHATSSGLRRLVAMDSPSLPPDGDARFGLLVRPRSRLHRKKLRTPARSTSNRAAILALGIAVGDARLARLVGLEGDTALVRRAVLVGTGAALRGRDDWSKHYTVSAALAVLEHPFVSDAAGLMKEQLDALAQGSGFSFGDLAADRAGVRFAAAATRSDAAAQAMQARLQHGFSVIDFFPSIADLPEALTVEQFRRDYGGVGSQQYHRVTTAIEARAGQLSRTFA